MEASALRRGFDVVRRSITSAGYRYRNWVTQGAFPTRRRLAVGEGLRRGHGYTRWAGAGGIPSFALPSYRKLAAVLVPHRANATMVDEKALEVRMRADGHIRGCGAGRVPSGGYAVLIRAV